MERGRHESVRFFFIHLGDIPSGDPLTAVWAKDSSVIIGEINRTIDDSIVVHFYKITFADFLIVGDETFTVGAAYLQDMAASDLSAVRVFVNLHHNQIQKCLTLPLPSR